MQDFVDKVLAHNNIDLTVAYLREKHKHVREPWGEQLTHKKIARLSGRVLIISIAIFFAVVALIGGVVTAIIQANQNGKDKPEPQRKCRCDSPNATHANIVASKFGETYQTMLDVGVINAITVFASDLKRAPALPALQPCPVKYHDALNLEHCTCHKDTCVRGQYCYDLNGDKPTCHPSAGANDSGDCYQI